jgi:hypothetical protein
MFGYIYLTTNLINCKKYIGKHQSNKTDDSYLGSGILLQKAIEKYGKENFKKEILKVCIDVDELNEQEIIYINQYNAVESSEFYNLMEGGCGGNTVACKTKEERTEICTKARKAESAETQKSRSDKVSIAHKGKSKTKKHRRAISKGRSGKGLWSDERRQAFSQVRQQEVADGIRVPPQGNAGNKGFEHKPKSIAQLKISLKLAREEAIEERGSYITEDGKKTAQEKKNAFWTDEEKAKHKIKLKKIRDGYLWYHNPKTKEKDLFLENQQPDGWVFGKQPNKDWD